MACTCRTCHRGPLVVLAMLAASCFAADAHAGATIRTVEHPFILWTKDDIARMREMLRTVPWYRAAYERMVRSDDRHTRCLVNLFRYAALGDRGAGEREKGELMRTVRSPVPRGAAQSFTVLRYDILYALLTRDERQEVEECFREYIENHIFRRAIFDPRAFNDSRRYSRYDARTYTRSNWLPNIIWPWKVSANLMAVALRDEALIRRVWAAYGSWQWYFDHYLCDIGFYAEEFSKMGSTPGAMFLYCLGLRRLGLDELGFGYRGKGGATMRGHIESILHLGYPRVDLGTSRPHYPMVTLGDLRHSGSSQRYNHPGYAFQHSIVMGYLRDGRGGTERWITHGAWGGTRRGRSPQWDLDRTPKPLMPIWLELGHRLWPDAGFDYFLAQMRAPDEEHYIPSIFFGLRRPIGPAVAKAPPAPSAVWPERGIAMLRADESPAYWESEAPAVALRLATNYAHHVNDCFALAGFYAFNRPIYLNRQTTPGYAQGWSRSIQSHCAVRVDGGEPRFTSDTTIRRSFGKLAKFVAVRSRKVYPGVDFARALVLTREYLLDVCSLEASQPRGCNWIVHALGQVDAGSIAGWKVVDGIENMSPELRGIRAFAVGHRPWSVTVLQDCPVPDPKTTLLGEAWYAKRVGVRIHLLGAPGTTAYVADTPRMAPHPRRPPPGPDEIGGVTVVAVRKSPRTAFVALHEPFKGASPRIEAFRRIDQAQRALGVAVVGKPGSGIDDRVLLCLGDQPEEAVTLSRGGESFRFAGYAFVRIRRGLVEAHGGLRAVRLRVEGQPRLIIEGRERQAAATGGFLTFGE